MSIDIVKMTTMWSQYRRAVYYTNFSPNVEMHKALFNIFCRELTFRLETAFNAYLSRVRTGYETQTLEEFSTCLCWGVVDAYECSSIDDGYLYDAFQITTTPTEDGRTKVHLFYRRDSNFFFLPQLDYDVDFPMLDERERDEVYAKFYK
jgi:hypothetical protein